MQIIDDDKVGLWLKQKGLSIRARKIVFSEGSIFNIGMEIPASSSRSMLLASVLSMLGEQTSFSGGLFWISTWGIWTAWSAEFGEYMITNLRAQGGPVVPLSNQSGHLLDPTDKMLTSALLWQTMLLNWDSFYIPSAADYVVEISHDELCWVICCDYSRSISIETELKPWNPQRREVFR